MPPNLANKKMIIILMIMGVMICGTLGMQNKDHLLLATAQVSRLHRQQAAVSLKAVANDWDYKCDIRSDKTGTLEEMGEPIVTGRIETTRLPSGINLCTSDLVSLRENQRTGIVSSSVLIAINLRGSALAYSIPGRSKIHIPAGSAFLMFASDEMPLNAHYCKGDRSQLLVMQCRADWIRDPLLIQEIERQCRNSRLEPVSLSARAYALANSLVSTGGETYLTGQLRCESCALELLACAIEQNDSMKHEKGKSIHIRDRRKIQILCEMMQDNLGVDYKLSDLAKEAGMSVTTLKSKFTAVTGQSVFQFLREHRLEKARAGLEQEGWAVSEAAFYVGYSHATNFSSAFRKRFGYPPIAARQSS